jgi:hypothetical protein
MIPKKPAPHLDCGVGAGSRLREALAKILVVWTNASAGVGRSEKIMRHESKIEGGSLWLDD